MAVAAAGGGHEAPSVRCALVLVDSVRGIVGVAREVDNDLRCACVRLCQVLVGGEKVRLSRAAEQTGLYRPVCCVSRARETTRHISSIVSYKNVRHRTQHCTRSCSEDIVWSGFSTRNVLLTLRNKNVSRFYYCTKRSNRYCTQVVPGYPSTRYSPRTIVPCTAYYSDCPYVGYPGMHTRVRPGYRCAAILIR